MNETLIDFIMFGRADLNDPLQCYKAGHMGCLSIVENVLDELPCGLDVVTYTINFLDGDSIEVRDTHYVEMIDALDPNIPMTRPKGYGFSASMLPNNNG